MLLANWGIILSILPAPLELFALAEEGG